MLKIDILGHEVLGKDLTDVHKKLVSMLEERLQDADTHQLEMKRCRKEAKVIEKTMGRFVVPAASAASLSGHREG